MIYFDHDTKLKLVNRFHQYMHPGSYLFIGHSESLGRSSELFKYVQPALYRKQ
jgi:chemotaxis protein methyltransferase CheR